MSFFISTFSYGIAHANPSSPNSLPSTLIDDFEDQSRNETNSHRLNLWGSPWNTVSSKSSMSVTYNGPGHGTSRYSAGVTGNMGGVEWAYAKSHPDAAGENPWAFALLQCPLYSFQTPVNVACHGLKGIQFWFKGDGSPYRIEVPNGAVTDGHGWYGFNFTAPMGQWTFYQVPFEQMTRQWKTSQEDLPDHPNGSDVMGIQFFPLINGPFSYSLDDISFYGSYVPVCPSPETQASMYSPLPSGKAIPTPARFILSTPTATLMFHPTLRQKPQPQPSQTPARLNPAKWPPLDPSLNVVFTEPPANIYITFADGPGRYQVEVVDARGNSLEAILDRRVVAESETWVEWNGLNQKGKLVSPGQYFVILSKDGKAIKRISVIREKPLSK